MLVDSHCHLIYPDFQKDIKDVLHRAKEAGVECMLTICARLSEFDSILDFVRTYDQLYGTVGVHPHDVKDYPELSTLDLKERVQKSSKIVGLGECGLDYYYEGYNAPLQKRILATHIEAGKKLDLPLIIHSREGEHDMIKLFDETDVSNNRTGKSPGVIHCFSGTKEFAYKALDRGFYISVSGIATFKKSDDLRAILKEIPLENLLVETDAPYLAPVPQRGKRNEPAFVVHTAKALAELKGISFKKVEQVTTQNFYKLFDKIPA